MMANIGWLTHGRNYLCHKRENTTSKSTLSQIPVLGVCLPEHTLENICGRGQDPWYGRQFLLLQTWNFSQILIVKTLRFTATKRTKR
jgi:hypothetical protein